MGICRILDNEGTLYYDLSNCFRSYLSSMRNIFLDILTQAPLPVMLLGPIAKGSGKPKWNHLPVQLFGKEQISERKKRKFIRCSNTTDKKVGSAFHTSDFCELRYTLSWIDIDKPLRGWSCYRV